MTIRTRPFTICVCICTYKRPLLLSRLLEKLEQQETNGLFDYMVVLIDNDRSESAKTTVEGFTRTSSLRVMYYVEPEQNIARARNMAVDKANGDYVAFIDDDEFPGPRWLLTLVTAIGRDRSDGVLGPVLPHFEITPPRWVLKGGIFDRPRHTTGQVLNWRHTRTGNALLRRDVSPDHNNWFDARYGSGGEDRDFFKRMIDIGRRFTWCNEAVVFETVPPNRWKRMVLIKRALLRGKMALNDAGSQPLSVLTSLVATIIYTAALPVLFLLGHHVFMKYLIKDCDHLGKVLSFLGVDLVQEKYVGG